MNRIFITFYAMCLIACSADTSPSTQLNKEPSMLLSTKNIYVIASPMEGVLMQNGTPLANTKIIRRLRWNSNDDGIEQEFMTDGQGRFSLPIHEEELTMSKLTQFTCSTHLEVTIDGQKHDVWYSNKFKSELYLETQGPTHDLVCDISAEEIVIRTGLANVMTTCRWKDMPESNPDY